MAGLEKFEASEEWKNKFKKHLFMERKIVQKPSESVIERQRYSMDIGAELKNILKEKNIPCLSNTPKQINKMGQQEDKENDFSQRNCFHSKDFKFNEDITEDISSYEHEKSHNKQDISDESFEAMEKICNKTASDPDSTLFKYIHSENKRGIIEETKKRLSAVNDSPLEECNDDEAAAIDRLLKDFEVSGEAEHHRKNNEMTQIEDIEAPSQFWNSTIVQTSPVKMIGLLRPSTILEETAGNDDSDATSSAQTSFTSAHKACPSEISSYETASETEYTENPCYALCIDDFKTENLEVDPLCIEKNILIDINESMNLIHFQKPTNIANNYQGAVGDSESLSESDESVIELFTDEENPLSPFSKNEEEETTLSCERRTTLIKWETPLNVKREVSSFNYSEGNSLTESPKSQRNSLKFNDSLEKVEYMMKKGLELIKAQNEAKVSPPKAPNNDLLTPKMLNERQNTFTTSPAKVDADTQPEYFEDKNPEAMAKCTPTSNSDGRFNLLVKPIPKLNLFKKPTSTSKPKYLGARPKDHFAHVVSPIATYVNKTSVTPLMTSNKYKSDNVTSKAFRELEYESRLHRSKINTFEAVKLERNPNARTLPKKAYISSELKQITDERSPITIPGGKSIQKYLDSAVTPAVICHDGKAKLPSSSIKRPLKFQRTGESKSNTPKRNESVKDMSLANLSVMSGDVSVYTIKDAQKL